MDVELKPCPWCGRVAKIKSNSDWHTLIVRHKNSCILRDAQSIFVPRTDEQKALLIKDWNNRHGAGDAEEGSLRFIAKRNLRRMIEIGSTDTKTMLLCLEELS